MTLFENLAAILETGHDVPLGQFHTLDPAYGPIFEKNIEKLGLLSTDLAERTVLFYGYLIAVRASLRNLANGAWDNLPHTALRKASEIRSGIRVWRDAEAIATPLVFDLRKIANESWGSWVLRRPIGRCISWAKQECNGVIKPWRRL